MCDRSESTSRFIRTQPAQQHHQAHPQTTPPHGLTQPQDPLQSHHHERHQNTQYSRQPQAQAYSAQSQLRNHPSHSSHPFSQPWKHPAATGNPTRTCPQSPHEPQKYQRLSLPLLPPFGFCSTASPGSRTSRTPPVKKFLTFKTRLPNLGHPLLVILQQHPLPSALRPGNTRRHTILCTHQIRVIRVIKHGDNIIHRKIPSSTRHELYAALRDRDTLRIISRLKRHPVIRQITRQLVIHGDNLRHLIAVIIRNHLSSRTVDLTPCTTTRLKRSPAPLQGIPNRHD